VHGVFTSLLMTVLIVSVISFAIMGMSQRRRTRRLARQAHEAGLRFFAEDPFDIPRAYADFAVMGSGHSLKASNVTYGRVEGMPVRAFDFRYELGHGTRRLTKRCDVIVIDSDAPVPALLMWPDGSGELPFAISGPGDGRAGPWRYAGAAALAEALAGDGQGLSGDELSIEARSARVMVCRRARRRDGHVQQLRQVAGIVRAIQHHARKSDGERRD